MKKKVKTICFDIETELFTDEFRYADDLIARMRCAPKMRLACTFDGKEWRYFLPSEAKALVKLLSSADQVISFNGKAFDELVLRKHHGLSGKFPIKGKHIDLLAEIDQKEGRRVSLHRLSEHNLAEPKHTKGRSIANLDIERLKEACRSDVWQTYRLWELWCAGKLMLPGPVARREEDEWFDVGPGHHMPPLCPRCHAVNTLILIEYDEQEMSEGQLADYHAGVSGTSYCDACEFEFDWGF